MCCFDRGRRCPALQCFDIRRDRDSSNFATPPTRPPLLPLIDEYEIFFTMSATGPLRLLCPTACFMTAV